jgi:hypothetical protein
MTYMDLHAFIQDFATYRTMTLNGGSRYPASRIIAMDTLLLHQHNKAYQQYEVHIRNAQQCLPYDASGVVNHTNHALEAKAKSQHALRQFHVRGVLSFLQIKRP